MIKVKKQASADEFFVPSLKTWIDLTSSDWTEVKLLRCDLQMIFNKMKKCYFGELLNNVNYTIKWDHSDIITDGTNYKIFESVKEIVISSAALTRPRVQLISVLLHILIHLYLTNASNETTRLGQHGMPFKKIMSFFNERIGTKISSGHTFIYSEDDSKYGDQWFQCTGICSNYQPFYGIIRCTSIPNEAMNFWSRHHVKCGGMFFKIFEAHRKTSDGSVEKKFVRNVKYMNPKANANDDTNAKSSKSSLPQFIRAQIDLTDESPLEQNLCAIINLDESEFVISDDDDEENAVEYHQTNAIITMSSTVLSTCVICQQLIGESRIASHLDSCTGFQQEVQFDRKCL